jgi:hypothetical protein
MSEIFPPLFVSKSDVYQMWVGVRAKDAVIRLWLDVSRLVHQLRRVFIVVFTLLVQVKNRSQSLLTGCVLDETTSLKLLSWVFK